MKPADKHDCGASPAGSTGADSIDIPLQRHLREMLQSRPEASRRQVFSELVALFDGNAPRYTSYPTADRFEDNFQAEDMARNLAARENSACPPLSLYVHIPFCTLVCHHCDRNGTITSDYRRVRRYISHLIEELALVDRCLGGDRRLQQLHVGGGTPTYLTTDDLERLLTAIRNVFEFSPSGEFAMEIDSRTVDGEKLAWLREAGFNRLSLGVQDFDPDVQTAINRVQSASMVAEVLEIGRALGFDSANVDLVHGLPRQTLTSIDRTMDDVITMRPDRIAIYRYVHRPSRFRAQRRIREQDIPDALTRQGISELCHDRLEVAGYEHIGLGQFALPDDRLARASRMGFLQRGFQGYSTQADCDVVGLGAGAMSRVGICYGQNIADVTGYCDRVSRRLLPTARGFELSFDDLLRRAIIMVILCQGEIHKTSFETSFLIDFDHYFRNELDTLKPLADLGYVTLEPHCLCVTPKGRRRALRLLASRFDRYLQQQSADP